MAALPYSTLKCKITKIKIYRNQNIQKLRNVYHAQTLNAKIQKYRNILRYTTSFSKGRLIAKACEELKSRKIITDKREKEKLYKFVALPCSALHHLLRVEVPNFSHLSINQLDDFAQRLQ